MKPCTERRSAALLFLTAGLVGAVTPVLAADDDALALEGVAAEPEKSSGGRQLGLELGVADLRAGDLGNASATGRKFALDYRDRFDSGPWHLAISDRLEAVQARDYPLRRVTNSLRELYVSREEAEGARIFELGRVVVRNGAGYGFNPVDFFREGAWRTASSVDPIAMRGYRQGTFMARAVLGNPLGTLSINAAPRLGDAPSDASFAIDARSTNPAHRLAVTQSLKFGDLNLLAATMVRKGGGPTLGLSASAAVGDALLGHAEWSTQRNAALADQALGLSAGDARHHQLAAGVTYTFPDRTQATLEWEYNGRGLDREDWTRLMANGGLRSYQALLAGAQASQELVQRRAVLVYLSRANLLVKNLDATALARLNGGDDGGFVWWELKYHFDAVDLGVQFQRGWGGSASEFGPAYYRSITQVQLGWHF